MPQERRGSWIQNSIQRFGSPRAPSKRSVNQASVAGIIGGTDEAGGPLLPLTMPISSPPLTTPSGGGGGGGVDTPISPGTPGTSGVAKQQQQQQQQPNHPSSSSKERKSVISSSRKIVSATVGRPLRAVGRAVSSRRGGGRQGSGGKCDDDEIGAAEYGTLMGEEIVSSDAEQSQLSSADDVATVTRRNSSCRRGGGEMIINRFRASAGGDSVVVAGGGGVGDPETDNWPVHYTEQLIRQIVLILIAYILGAKFPDYIGYVSKATEYAVTAWATCVLILCLASIQRKFPHIIKVPGRRRNLGYSQQQLMAGSEEEQIPLLANSVQRKIATSTPVAFVNGVNGEELPVVPPLPVLEPAQQQQGSDQDSAAIDEALFDKNIHPALSCYYLMDTVTGERIYPNTMDEPAHLSTEWFELDMLVLIRTPDVDDPSLPTYEKNIRAMKYFRGKQRHFEFQYQFKLKKNLPPGVAVMFACELDEQIKIGMIQKAFVGAAMAFIKTTNPTFHYSISGSKDKNNDGTYEKPHMAFTVEGSLDRLVITKPGETPPELGTIIHEDPESVKRRKKGMTVDWNTRDTYTMALWTSYVDFIDWRCLNLPGIRPFGLSSVLGQQPFYMNMYMIKENRGNDKHYEKDKQKIVNLELSNETNASLGPSAKEWAARNRTKIKQLQQQQQQQQQRVEAAKTSEKATGGDVGETATMNGEEPYDQEIRLNSSADDLMGEPDDDADEDEETAAELGEGIYMRSGDSVVLREFTDLDVEENTPTFSLSSGGGFAVLQERDVNIFVEKARKSKRNRLIKSGDVVMFKMIQKKGEDTETRYLTIHRGWWLKWVSSAPSKNGYFTIEAHDSECVRSDETVSSYLTMGGTFTMRHKRWSSYRVGVAADPSATYGGRMLGLYNPKSGKGSYASSSGGGGGSSGDDHYQSDEGEMALDDDLPDGDDNKSKIGWMKPLILSAHDPNSLVPSGSPKANLLSSQVGGDVEDGALSDSPTGLNQMTPTFIFPKYKLNFSNEHASADVPAWIEMMNRTDRVRQLTYVVRVIQPAHAQQLRSPLVSDEAEMDESSVAIERDPETFVRLRTGREVARIMQVGQSKKYNYLAYPGSGNKKSRTGESSSSLKTEQARNPLRNSFQGDGMRTPTSDRKDRLLTLSPARSNSVGDLSLPLDDDDKDEDSIDESVVSDEEDISAEEIEPLSSEDESEPESILESDAELDQPIERSEKKHGAVHKSKKIIGKVAKVTGKTAVKTVLGTGKLTAKTVVGTGKLTAKTVVGTGKLTKKTVVGTGKLTGAVAKGTSKVAVGAGKAAMKGSKKVAKGTVSAGKALTVGAGKAVVAPISRKGKKPPKAEPKKRGRDKQEKHMGVSKSMKKIGKIEAKSDSKSAHTSNFLAGELCAPEQSCRTASRVLQRMSNVPFMSPAWKSFNDVLCSEVAEEADQDRWFLEGNSVHLGVTPLSGGKSRGSLLHESVVARCLWESHWREEWCGMYPSCLSFYSPLTKSPCLEIAYIDITNVRPLDPGYLSPLPGFPLLVLETAWLCYYISFKDEEARDTFGEKVEDAIERHVKQVEETVSIQESDLRTARFWQGFQSLSQSSLSSGVGKWAKVSSNQKHKERAILNGRRMGFDMLDTNISDMSNGFNFVEDLLSRALSFSLESLEKDPESFVEFLDLTSQLRLLPLDEIDLSSRQAFCLFANIYHCLLQQAMLLSVNGPLQKKSVEQFMRTSSYEIGGDVFSLAELYCCVLRGKMSKAVNPKPPYIEAPRKSSTYRYYALDYNDPRVNFVLNTGDIACPASAPILRPRSVEEQLNKAASVFLRQELAIDTKKRLVILPKVCEVYKPDFGPDSLSCLKFCMGGLDEGTASTIRVMMMDGESNLSIRYQHTAEQYHISLKLRNDFPFTSSSSGESTQVEV